MPSQLSRAYRPAATGFAAGKTSAAFALFVFLFLAFFQPFGLGLLGSTVWRVALGYGIVCFVLMFLMNVLAPRLVPGIVNGEGWTVGREIVWILTNMIVVGLGNAVYSMVMGLAPFTAAVLIQFELYTVAIGIFPVVAVVLLNEARLTRRYQEGSQRMNADLRQGLEPDRSGTLGNPTPRVEASLPVAVVTIPSETGREDLEVRVPDLLFIRSSGNYIEVHVAVAAAFQRNVLRGSLKRTEEALAAYPRLLRCHKSHLVNLDRVVSVSGNAQGYHLHLGPGVDRVPVSRQLNDRLADLLSQAP